MSSRGIELFFIGPLVMDDSSESATAKPRVRFEKMKMTNKFLSTDSSNHLASQSPSDRFPPLNPALLAVHQCHLPQDQSRYKLDSPPLDKPHYLVLVHKDPPRRLTDQTHLAQYGSIRAIFEFSPDASFGETCFGVGGRIGGGGGGGGSGSVRDGGDEAVYEEKGEEGEMLLCWCEGNVAMARHGSVGESGA